MKKILSVALSTAMAFSMFASVAFGDTAVTPQQQFDALKAKGIFNGYPDGSAGLDKEMTRAEFAKVITKLLGLKEITGQLSYTDKNYTAKNWAVPYIEAVTAAGIMEGKNVEKKIFDFNGKVTVAEMATILTRALDLEIPAETDNSAPAWAKGYVQAAINAGLVDAKANFSANASRELLVGAAYSIDQAQSLKVTSYEVSEAGKVVTFKISDGESVKVTLDKALEANKETEVKFTYKDKEFTEKVTYKTTVAQAVATVSATNVKEITVKFDGTVDAATAADVDNYAITGKSFESASLSEDKTTVTLLLDENSSLTNQKSTELSISNVKNADSTKTFAQKVTFTPADVAVPTVETVTALGTKAIKVKFSEPVRKAEALLSSNYKIDGKVIAASVVYSYPDTVILTTNVTEGAHKLTVSNVTDFSGLTLVPVEYDFTAAVDTTAPEVVSVTSSDLTKVTVEFNEPVKRVDSVYANVSSNTPSSIKVSDTKVTLTFPNGTPLNYAENTIYLKGVRDYSDNSADREAKVTPTLDTTRPTIVNTEVKTDTSGNYIARLKFSETLKSSTLEDRANYVLKDANGKVADLDGTNASGNPIVKPYLDPNATNTVVVNLGKDLTGSYTLTVSNIQDMAYVPNTMLPYTFNLDAGQAAAGKINRSWIETVNATTKYVYIEFNKTVATSGAGNALEAAKYSFSTTQGGTYNALTTDNNDIQLVSSDTVRITTTSGVVNDDYVRASYVANADGVYFTQDNSYNLGQQIKSNAQVITLKTDGATVTSDTELKLEFNGKLSYVDINDFVVNNNGTNVRPTSYTTSSDGTVLTLKFDSLPVDTDGVTLSVTNGNTQDSYGNKVVIPSVDLVDKVAPKAKSVKIAGTATPGQYTATITLSEKVEEVDNTVFPGVQNLFTAKVNNTDATVNSVVLDATNKNVITVTFTTAGSVNIADTDKVKVDYSAAYTKAFTDGGDNNLAAFTFEDLYNYLK
ncbi:S-layer homology domain-containing protein [Paenibacillus silvae]|nr:S-layer homology domain-containing protein [Paenibacillus silvae]